MTPGVSELDRTQLRLAKVQTAEILCYVREVPNHERRELRGIEIASRRIDHFLARHGIDLRYELLEIGIRAPIERQNLHRARDLLRGFESSRVSARQRGLSKRHLFSGRRTQSPACGDFGERVGDGVCG